MRFIRFLFLSVLALLVIGVIVLWTLPAATAWHWVAERAAPLRLAGLSGSIWDGRAAEASLLGHALGELAWQIEKQPLLHGEVAAQVRINGTQVTAESGLRRRSDGSIELKNTTAEFGAALLAPALDIPALTPLGIIKVHLTQGELRNNWPANLVGTAHWREAGVSGVAEARFGDMEAQFASTPDGSIAGSVRDLGGPLAVAGTFTSRIGQFEADVILSVRGDDPRVREALQFVGEPQPDGSSRLLIRGDVERIF